MPEYHGSLVAFEGAADVISTQLRLLPTSPQILILPGIQNYLPSESSDGAFEPATYLLKVHDAAATRTAAATSFLRDATPDSKRLVFVHGGTPSAYALCIDAFTKHETAGDRRRAETLFEELVVSGVAGLAKRKTRRRNKRGLVLDDYALFQAQFEDPITRAMRAADALDEQTAALQPDADLSMRKPRPRSMSLPVYGYVDHLGDSAPFYVFGASAKQEVEDGAIEDEGIQGRSFFLQSPRLDASFLDDEDELEPLETPRRLSIAPRSPSCMGEAYRSRYNSVVVDDAQSVLEAGDVIIGEASLVRMSKEMPPRNLKRVKSLDTGTAPRGSCRDLPLRLAPTDMGEDALENLRRFSCVDPTQERLPISPVSPRFSIYGSPKTVFVKPARLTRKDTVRPARASYVDKGTDAEGDAAAEGAFQPVLPFSEDMVLYFDDESPDPLLESVIESFRAGTYPPPPPSSLEARRASAVEHLVGSTHRQSTPPRSEEDSSSVTNFMEAITKPISLNDDYDPFAYDKQPKWAASARTTTSISPTITPPTPAQTPPPPPATMTSEEGKITDFDTTGCHTAVALQNALRSVLEKRLPAENGGFHQFSFQHLPELGRLWKPIFTGDAGSQSEEGRSVDQIIAVGAQAGVRREFVASVSRRLEMLGSDPSGALRSGRLDFRYLLVNAMQSFTAQPLAKQAEDPFSNPYLLATLIIPHLETYLAAHSETGLLLLEFPPDHLSTVLAIQRLVGVELMKVAQVVDSGLEPMPFAHIRGSPIHSDHLSPPSGSPNLSSTCQADSLPFTHANFLLTSSATEDEIEDFIDTVSKILVEISPLYAPRPKSSALSSPSKNTFGSNRTFSTAPISIPAPPSRHSSLPRRPPSPALSDRSQLTGETRGNTPPSSSHAHFVVSSRKDASPRSEATSRDHRPTFEHRRQDSVQTYDGPEFEDLGFELDLEEKRLMPIFMGKEKRVSSQKALKFLGLA